MRRKPQKILSVTPAFNPDGFHFNKVKPEEVLFELEVKDGFQVDFLVNSSPLTINHCLLCPNRHLNLSQILNADSISFALAFLAKIKDSGFKIGFNSPGALASVNHLHLHLMQIDVELFVEKCVNIPALIRLNLVILKYFLF